jgi:hypothetical protein
MTASSIQTIPMLLESLQNLGFLAEKCDETVIVTLGQFKASLSLSEKGLTVFCQVGKLSELPNDEALRSFCFQALLQNATIQPFAFALLDGDTERPGDDTIVLTNSVPTGDLCVEELHSLIASLRSAILTSAHMLREHF